MFGCFTFSKISLSISSGCWIFVVPLFQSISITRSFVERDAQNFLPSKLNSDWILPADILQVTKDKLKMFLGIGWVIFNSKIELKKRKEGTIRKQVFYV